jgi:hypothetical protein
MEDHDIITLLDLLIVRNKDKLEIDVYRKPSTTDTTMHFIFNHPMEHKLAVYRLSVIGKHHSLLTPTRKYSYKIQ